jgi:hypothetical protein
MKEDSERNYGPPGTPTLTGVGRGCPVRLASARHRRISSRLPGLVDLNVIRPSRSTRSSCADELHCAHRV